MQLQADASAAGKRLDIYLQEMLPAYSRSRLQAWIKSGRVLMNGAAARASATLRGGEVLQVEPAELKPLRAEPEELPLTVLYQDEDVVVVDKPAGMVVHAGAGHTSGTLVNALLHHFGRLSNVNGDERPGIVHRLDRETSGALLVARTDAAHQNLAKQFQDRTVEKIYLALVEGVPRAKTGRITLPIARDPARRTRMTTKLSSGRSALTDYEILEELPGPKTLLRIKLGTGRTHQIRVHLASLGHPVVGDRLYGAPAEPVLERFFLHAHRLSFSSPSSASRIRVESPLPFKLAQYLRERDAKFC